MSFDKDTSFLNGSSSAYIGDLYEQYLENPSRISEDWRLFFEALKPLHKDSLSRPSWRSDYPFVSDDVFLGETPTTRSEKEKKLESSGSIKDSLRALMMIRAYRVRGHLSANLDPLGIEGKQIHPELDPSTYGFSEKDLDKSIFLDGVLGLEYATLKEIMALLKKTYCGSVGVEFMHLINPEEKAWVQERFEDDCPQKHITTEERREIYENLLNAETFERFLNKKYKGAKRFGLEGCEAFIPALKEAIGVSASFGTQEVVLGMAHRGRLNVLANVMGKPLEAIFSEFQGMSLHSEEFQGSGDVKYHLGYSSDVEVQGKKVHLSLTANPSHLEAVNPVVLGKVRAKQDIKGDKERKKTMGILVHGDAAFSGQGIVAECFGLSDLRGYKTGGTLHIVTNNQIGFTTSPTFSRSTPYCSDLAKVVLAPIFHVNGDDLEAVIFAVRLASEFRMKFKKDVVIDIWGYRRYGHNESDDPSFTQPLMYQKIESHDDLLTIYSRYLDEKSLISKEFKEKLNESRKIQLSDAFEQARHFVSLEPGWLKGDWSSMVIAAEDNNNIPSGFSAEKLKEMTHQIYTNAPEGFTLHKRWQKVAAAKLEALKSEVVDWATAEALAFGSLLSEGIMVRLSGQDSGRGTFSQRHAVLVDQKTGEKFVPLQHLKEKKSATFSAVDSPLSEASVLGFEYGLSLASPTALVIWEAQFGDFANGAQAIIDQFIASGETKWMRFSGLVLLLPHGFEGQGPEHSSARLERYLQLCAEYNMQVANCTTPANYFHILRRQVERPFRKPLVLMTPKSLLRHKQCVSTFADMDKDTHFQSVIGEIDKSLTPKNIRRIVICSGKVYYDLKQYREDHGVKDVVIVRLEQIYPFPEKELEAVLLLYKKAEVVWCQEEPQNAGAWFFVDRLIEAVMIKANMKHKRPLYIGRKASASPATGFAKQHEAQQEQLLSDALNN